MEDIFRTPGIKPRAYYGWIGDNPRTLNSVRVPGAENLLDPDWDDGYLRALSGDLSMTAAQWRGEQGGTWHAPAFQATPATPSGFGATAYNNRWVRLSWQPVSVNYYGGAKYTIYRNGKKIGSAGTATTFDNQPATVGSHTYQVKSVDPAAAESALSAPITVQVLENTGQVLPNATPAPTASPTRTPTPTPSAAPTSGPTAAPTASPIQAPAPTPSATPTTTPTTAPVVPGPLPPTGLTAVAQPDLKVAVGWSASPSAANGPVKYRVYRNGYLVATTRNLTYLSALWLPGTNKYQVQTVDAAGVKSVKTAAVWVRSYTDGTPTNVVDTTPPTVPTGLTAESLGDRQVRLTWNPSTDTGPSAVGYLVMRGKRILARASEPWFLDTPGKIGEYTYKITAFDGYGNLAATVKVVGEAVL
jgi:hypothetical protein